MKPVLFTLLFALSFTVAQGQGKNKTTVFTQTDTMEVVITPLVYLVQDTAYNCFMVTEPHGAFQFFGSRESLDGYLEFTSSLISFFVDHAYYGTGTYVQRYSETAQPDTVRSYRSMIMDQVDQNGARLDTVGYPLWLLDLEHSYILQRMGKHVNGPYVYCLITEGQKFFGPMMPVPTTSTLVALDLEQDTISNFFVFKASLVSDAGMQFIRSDTMTIPLKKLRRKHSLIPQLDQLLSIKNESDVHYLNAHKTYVLITGERRFVFSADPYRRERVEDEWVQLVESIASTVEHMLRKYVSTRRSS